MSYEPDETESPPCDHCGDGCRVPNREWHCPECDAYWPAEELTRDDID